MERSIEFNNAGVECIAAGHHKVAWDLFKGALEIKLALERKAQADSASLEPSHQSNTYIEKAQHHLTNIESYLSNRTGATSDLPPSPSTSTQQDPAQQRSSDRRCQRMNLPRDPLDAPFIFTHPMRLSTDREISTRKQSATIIFNLALVDHLKNRCSEQAVALYELAMTLLTGDTVDILGIALMNNIGVWCYENGDMDGALSCMGHLASFIGSCSVSIDQQEKDGLQSNILWLTNPPFAASPAA